MRLTKVIIGGVTIKDDDDVSDPKKVIRWEYEKDDETISEAELLVLKDVTDLVDLNSGQVVQIYAGWTTSTDERFFYGYIENIKPEGAVYRIICRNEMIDLVRRNVNKVYDSSVDASAGEISEIAEDLIETYGEMSATVQSSGTADGQRIDEFKCINTDIYERLSALKKALNWDLYYDDANRIVMFEPYGNTSSGITLTAGTDIIGVPQWTFDKTNLINDLRVDGAFIQTDITETGQIGVTSGYATTGIDLTYTPDVVDFYLDASDPPTTQKLGGSKDSGSGNDYYVDRENKRIEPASGGSFTTNHYAIIHYTWSAPSPIHLDRQESIDTYGKHEKQITMQDVTSIADAETRAENILNVRSQPFVSAKLMVKSVSSKIPRRGQTIAIIDEITPQVNGLTYNGNYYVSSIKFMYPSAYEEIEIGDREWVIVDMLETTEQRLKRLEEQFVRNQDIIREIKSFNLQIEHVPRYLKLLSQVYDSGSGISIWGLGDGDGYYDWGSGEWGTHADAFQTETTRFMQQYKNTYTENFGDSDFFDTTNSTGTWGVADAGETIRSLPIDYNNGTITTATATFTGSGTGTPTYYMSANGGTNWETVTSGTPKTFSNSGTDLRWRMDSAGNTYTLTGVTITNYH